MNIKTICVCGAGTMGTGIAQVAASAGFSTILYELNPDVLKNAKSKMETDLQKLVHKQKITQKKSDDIQQKISLTSNIENCIADVVIEAIVEKLEVKTSLFKQLSDINNTEAIFASNTSSLSITELAKNIEHPERVIGMHFFNPAPLMKLVEIVTTNYNNERTKQKIIELTRQMGKEPAVCKDSPGFIVNRVARPFYIESFRIAEEGHVEIETIDRLLESNGFRLGPFKLMDLIGNDVNYAVSCSVYEQLNNPERLKPSYIQKEKVDKNELGKKSGKGYYTYTPSP